MSLIGKLTCWLTRKHLRGRFVRQDGDKRVTRCDRCGKETQRKVKGKTV